MMSNIRCISKIETCGERNSIKVKPSVLSIDASLSSLAISNKFINEGSVITNLLIGFNLL